MKPLISGCKAVFIILIWACTAPLCVHAQTFNVLYSFSYAAQSGQDPLGQLVQASDGYLYGTTYTDANGGNGSIFKMDLSGNVTTVHYFNGSDGVSPNGDLIQATNGLIYGTCYQGGAYNGGTVWSLDPTSGMVTDLHDFTGYNYSNPVDSGGSGPEAGVTQASDGNLYGTTWYGGQYSGYSTLFELDLSGSSFNIIHSFDLYDDGLYPGGRLTEGKDGNLYGGVLEGGSTGYGLLFRVAKSGSSFTVLHTFAGPEGAYYNYGALLQLPDGNFYGTCYEGGVNNAGTIFQLNPTTESLTALYSFGGVNGESPGSGLTLGSDGMLYGDTDLGGKFGLGTAFKTDTSGNVTVLHNFNGLDAGGANTLTLASDGNFYGVSGFGGVTGVGSFLGGYGSAFKMTPSGTVTLLYSFGIYDLNNPVFNLIQATDGYFYGIASFGGAFNLGALYRTDAAGNLTIVHSFNQNFFEGGYPNGGVAQGKDGFLYGTTIFGGQLDWGTIYKTDLAGNLTVLHDFVPSEGTQPIGTLLQAQDGDFYGACQSDTTGGGGSIFKISSKGKFTVIHSFTGPDGSDPQGDLVQDSKGNLYGVTYAGGANSFGTVFRMTTSGAITVLHSFNNSDGAYPDGLLLGRDGFLYGTCFEGGKDGLFTDQYSGTLFKTDPSTGATTVLNYFDTTSGGGEPVPGIMQGPDGNLYGTCSDVEPGDTVWEANPTTGAFTLLHSFDYYDGYYPYGGVVLGSDGVFYGTTTHGGANLYGGNLFSIDSGLANAASVTSSVKVTKTAPKLVSGVWTATITIKNESPTKAVILGPLQAVLVGLPSGATLLNATGIVPSGFGSASGNPYVTAPGGPNGIFALDDKKSVTLTVHFNQNVGTGYTVQVFTGRF